MNKFFFIAIAFIFLVHGFVIAEEQHVTKAKEFLELVNRKEFGKASQMFNEVLLAQMPEDKLAEIWNSIEMQAGKFTGRIDLFTEKVREYDVVVQTCQFANLTLDLRLVFDAGGEIGGIFFAPSKPKNAYILPPYNRPENYTVKTLEIITGDFRLPATLTMPRGEGLFPAFILVHGSGAHDRDATIGPNKPFADLASGLSSNGIAVLRYDKRNFVYGENAFKGVEVNLFFETIEDVLSAIQLLKQTPGLDPARIYVLGHSLGAMAAPRIAAKVPELAGIVKMAGSARPLEDLILEQVSYLYTGQKIPEALEFIAKLKQQVANVKKLGTYPDISKENLPLNIPATYWIDLQKNNHVSITAGLNTKILILQGERDYQVTMTNYNIWTRQFRRKESVTMKSYPLLNHLFLEGEGKSTPKEYEIRGNIPWYVIKDIIDWVKQQ